MMNVLDELKYTEEHEWIKIVDSESAYIGITDFAQKELGDIVFLELPNVGEKFEVGDTFGTIEAVKTVADLFAPISGSVVDINSQLESNPELINKSPYNLGWIIKIKIDDIDQLNSLLSANNYINLIK